MNQTADVQRHLALMTLLADATDHAAADLDRGWRELLDGLAPLLNARWGYCLVVIRDGPDPDDPLNGWRVTWTLLPETHPDPDLTLSWAKTEPNLLDDTNTRRRAADSGRHRADRHTGLAEGLSPEDDASVALFEALGVSDELCGMHALSPEVEVFFGYMRPHGAPSFSEADRALLELAVSKVGRLSRWLALSLGAYPGQAPLSPRERETLSHLLRGQPEKLIADAMGLKRSSCHQLVVAVYRKLGVQSRAELMSLWLGHETPGSRDA